MWRILSLYRSQENPVNAPAYPLHANVARHIVHKTQHWALRLSEFNFTGESIPEAFNTWADLLTRWSVPGNEESLARLLNAFPVPLIAADLPELRSLQAISKSLLASPPQSDAGCSVTSNLGTDIWMTKNGKIYIPEDGDDLQLRICVAAH